MNDYCIKQIVTRKTGTTSWQRNFAVMYRHFTVKCLVSWPMNTNEAGRWLSFASTTKGVRSVSKQGHLQPHCHSKIRSLSKQLYNDLFPTPKFCFQTFNSGIFRFPEFQVFKLLAKSYCSLNEISSEQWAEFQEIRLHYFCTALYLQRNLIIQIELWICRALLSFDVEVNFLRCRSSRSKNVQCEMEQLCPSSRLVSYKIRVSKVRLVPF